jgi:hypothetical protein
LATSEYYIANDGVHKKNGKRLTPTDDDWVAYRDWRTRGGLPALPEPGDITSAPASGEYSGLDQRLTALEGASVANLAARLDTLETQSGSAAEQELVALEQVGALRTRVTALEARPAGGNVDLSAYATTTALDAEKARISALDATTRGVQALVNENNSSASQRLQALEVARTGLVADSADHTRRIVALEARSSALRKLAPNATYTAGEPVRVLGDPNGTAHSTGVAITSFTTGASITVADLEKLDLLSPGMIFDGLAVGGMYLAGHQFAHNGTLRQLFSPAIPANAAQVTAAINNDSFSLAG